MKTALGAAAYAAYSKAVGGLTFDGKPLPTYDELGTPQQGGWTAAAKTAGFAVAIGQKVNNGKGVSGEITNLGIGRDDKRGVWIEGTDSTGRPFEHYIREEEVQSE
jgi:hypothetical protein